MIFFFSVGGIANMSEVQYSRNISIKQRNLLYV